MATALEAAFPLNSNWPAATVRSKLAEAMIAVFDTPDLSGEDFSIQPYPAIAIYGPDGDLTLYAFDATDTVTADDGGVSCIVVSGRRYKRAGEMMVKDAAISATTATQPASPSLGDTYIVPAAPSGDDWASQAKTVATFTARGWIFRQPFVGMMVYVADQDAIYHYDSNGDWIGGLPIGAIQDGSIPAKKLEHPFAILKAEDERDTPPGSPPTIGTMYQVGTSPTGDFVGHDREIARWTGSVYEFLAPAEGDTIYRVDERALYTMRSGVWERTTPRSPVSAIYRETQTGSASGPTGVFHELVSKSIAALPGEFVKVDLVDFTGTLSAASSSIGGGSVTMGVRIDTESSFSGTTDTASADANLGNATSIAGREPTMMYRSSNPPLQGLTKRSFIVPVLDSLPHKYAVCIRTAGQGGSITNYYISATFSVVSII